MILRKQIKLYILLLTIYAIQSSADNRTTNSSNNQQPEEIQIIYPENVNALSKQLFDLELQNSQDSQESNCKKSNQSTFSIKDDINMINQTSQPTATSQIPTNVLSKFTGSLFFSNEEINDLINAQNTAQKP
jgi:hypothetical protein